MAFEYMLGVWFFKMVCIAAVPLSQNMEAVVLSSTLKQQSSLCPDDLGAVITCNTIGSSLVWDVNRYVVSFREHMPVGEFYVRNGYSMHLLRKEANFTTAGDTLFVSALSIMGSNEFVRIGCHNGLTSNERFFEYNHTIPDQPPSPPSMVHGTMYTLLLNNIRTSFLNVTWEHENSSDISHYTVQVGSAPPFNVSAGARTFHKVMENSTDDSKDLNTVRVAAVDLCQRSSSARTEHLDKPVVRSDSLECLKDIPSIEQHQSSKASGWLVSKPSEAAVAIYSMTDAVFMVRSRRLHEDSIGVGCIKQEVA